MVIGQRLRALREKKNLSQGHIEKKTGLLRCYISRVENGYTVPAVETLEKFARALEIPMYQLFYDGVEPPVLPNLRWNQFFKIVSVEHNSTRMLLLLAGLNDLIEQRKRSA